MRIPLLLISIISIAYGETVLVSPHGTYPTLPLAKDEIVVKVVQNLVKNIEEFQTPEEGLKINLESMTSWIIKACNEQPKPDFILFNEFPLTGYTAGPREKKLKMTIAIPGNETIKLGQLAKQCNSYLIFGSYARDLEWPGHILSINVVINPKGEIAKKFWKSKNIKRFGLEGTGEIPTTTIESVYTKYVKKYGIEELFPVLKTEYGNIAVSTVQLDPFVFAAFAMRGVEIMFRTATLFAEEDVLATARYFNLYTAMANIIFPSDKPYSHLGGGSLIVNNSGKIIAHAKGNVESIATSIIPIKKFREGRTIPRFSLQLVQPLFYNYQDEIPLDHMDLPPDQLPSDEKAMKKYLDSVSRWIKK
ncbi:MAG: nitrilase-related carbon-nitrogen hydrolase [Methylacidiphilales bacterium]|nr:nitrilase-related carbon-nitrogen hydrolase [Candidatus Methylacidiphilales bacterium]